MVARARALPPWAVVGPAVASGRALRRAAGPNQWPLALFFSRTFSDLVSIIKLVNSK
jgi:hypothetical protein